MKLIKHHFACILFVAVFLFSFQSCQQDDYPVVDPPKQVQAVFMGNSITANWVKYDNNFFTKNYYEGRGISGQVSAQMLLRMENDVINLKPRAVVINAGTNDIGENAGAYNANTTFNNIKLMVQMAQANNIKVVLSSVLPVNLYIWRPYLTNVVAKVIDLNSKIKNYADANNIPYIDYHSALKDKDNGLSTKYGIDGLHPNLEGYRVMEPLAKQAIDKALKQ